MNFPKKKDRDISTVSTISGEVQTLIPLIEA